ncbi:MAG: hypothetical protein U1E97_11305 [Alphaproteobacteria bacterium]
MLRSLGDTARAYGAWLATERQAHHPVARAARDDRHALVIAWSLPPLFSGGTPRPCSFLRHAPEFGWRVSALGGPAPENPTAAGLAALATLPPTMRILRSARPKLKPSHRLFDRLADIDGSLLAAIALYRAGLEGLRDDPPAVVLASGPPFCVFVAGLFLARVFGARLVLDYRDEWTENPFDFVDRYRLDRWWEERCQKSASRVIFATDSLRRHQLVAFPGLDPARAATVPNGWESEPENRTGPAARPTGVVRLGFVGTLAQHSPAGPFLAALEQVVTMSPDLVSQVRVTLIGHKMPEERAALQAFPHPGMIEEIGLLPKDAADARMRDFDALLVFATRDLARYFPGKLFEYIAARVPVLIFGHRGEASETVERIGAGLFVPEGGSAALLAAITRLQAGPFSLDANAIDAWLAAHHRRALAQRLFALLDDVVRHEPVQRSVA